jgi:hypothetical protein
MAGYFWRVVIDNENWVWQWDDLFFILIPEIAMIALDRQSILCSEVDCAGGKSNTTTTVPDGSTTTTTITPTTTIPPNKVCGEFVDTWINWQNATHYSRSIKFEGKYALKGQIPIDDDFTNNGWDYLEPYLSDHPGNQFMSVSFNAGEGTVTYTIVSLNGKYFDASAYLRDTYCQYCMPVFPDPFDLNPDPPCSNARQYLIQEDPDNVCTRHWRFLAP